MSASDENELIELKGKLESARKAEVEQRLAWHALAGKASRLCDAVEDTIKHLRGESSDVRDAMNVGIQLAASFAVVRREIES